MVIEACLYNLQVMGEALSKIPDNIKNSNSEIPWALIKGTRNRLIHEYFGTDLQIIWDIIQTEIPLLKPKFQNIYEQLIKTEQ